MLTAPLAYHVTIEYQSQSLYIMLFNLYMFM